MTSERKKTVFVCGLIGSGKSTLTEALATALGGLALTEPDEAGGRNPYLAAYYADPARWALTMQLHLLNRRWADHLYAQQHAALGLGHVVLDSGYYADTTFARLQRRLGHLTEAEFATYQAFYAATRASVLLPSAVVYVRVTPTTARRRIAARLSARAGRACEAGIDEAYLGGLGAELDAVVEALRAQQVHIVELPYDEDLHPDVVTALARGVAYRIQDLSSDDPFLDLHRRTT